MKRRITGLMAFVWGALIIVRHCLVHPAPGASQAYEAGANVGLVFGVIFVIAGLFQFVRSFQL